ncbi:MAG: hypothetical protein Q8N03_17055, partial [Ignavibacteria bacterium]|nr:hypothetical protein [Ignavibacteria bacterium]
LLFTAVSCNKPTEPPPPEKYDLEIIAADASCTEVWIDVKTPNTLLPQIFTLTENGEEKGSVTIDKADTTIVIENLLPKKNYKYQLKNNEHKSNQTEITTLDTTSHNFTWQTFEFGQHSSSVLYDVAIIDENNIWAVGEIYMNDSNGNPDPTFYNAVHWNGTEWELKKIFYKGGIWPIRTIFAFNDNDIWFSGYMRYLNSQFIELAIPNLLMGWQINKLWGTSSDDLYAVGNGGNIAHWNGSSWKKIESPIGTSGTDLTLLDIQANGREEIFICGLNMASIDGIIIKSEDGINFNILVEGDNITAEQLFNPKLHGTIASISVDNSNTLYAAGNLVYQYKFNKWDYLNSLPENYIGGNPGTFYRGYITKIRAIASNNIWLAGDRNTVRHFNGLSWQQIGMPYNPQMDLIWRGIDSRSSLTAIAGSHNNNAIIMIIK